MAAFLLTGHFRAKASYKKRFIRPEKLGATSTPLGTRLIFARSPFSSQSFYFWCLLLLSLALRWLRWLFWPHWLLAKTELAKAKLLLATLPILLRKRRPSILSS
jgi:hypothetical protein